MSFKISIALLYVGFAFHGLQGAESRVWTGTNGTTIQGTIIIPKAGATHVQVRSATGKVYSIEVNTEPHPMVGGSKSSLRETKKRMSSSKS
jgi:hypothetical protein